jgi:hypothetical protein
MEHQFDRVDHEFIENSCNFFYGAGTSQQIQSNYNRRKHGSNDEIHEKLSRRQSERGRLAACQSFHTHYTA